MADKKMKGKWTDESRHVEEQSVGEILARITSRGVIADKLLQVKVVEVYESVVGKQIARMTDKLFVRKGKLYLKVSSSALKQELVYSRGKIMELINGALEEGRISEVVVL